MARKAKTQKAEQQPLQMPLLVSPRYWPTVNWMMHIYSLTHAQVHNMICKDHPFLLDPNYKGHDKNGKPCKSLTRKKA